MKNCGNCANYDHAKMKFTDVCGSCIIAHIADERQEPSNWKPLPQTNADRIRSMSDEELADFFFESPEIEFAVCECCEYFDGHTSDTPCKHDSGLCLIPAKNTAFKKWLRQPAEEENA